MYNRFLISAYLLFISYIVLYSDFTQLIWNYSIDVSISVSSKFGKRISTLKSLENLVPKTFGFPNFKLSTSAGNKSLFEVANRPFTSAFYEKVLILNNVINDSIRILQFSFNAEEGIESTFRIYNTSDQLVKESDFELIKSHYYASNDHTYLFHGKYGAIQATHNTVHKV